MANREVGFGGADPAGMGETLERVPTPMLTFLVRDRPFDLPGKAVGTPRRRELKGRRLISIEP